MDDEKHKLGKLSIEAFLASVKMSGSATTYSQSSSSQEGGEFISGARITLSDGTQIDGDENRAAEYTRFTRSARNAEEEGAVTHDVDISVRKFKLFMTWPLAVPAAFCAAVGLSFISDLAVYIGGGVIGGAAVGAVVYLYKRG